MKRWGIKPIYLGPGAGLGYRYNPEHIDAVIERLETANKPQAKKPKKKTNPAKQFFNQSFSDAQKALTGTTKGK